MLQLVKRTLARMTGTEAHYVSLLDALDGQVNEYLKDHCPPAGPTVLYGPSFAVHGPCFIHDRILAAALRLRGAGVIPIYCDAVQSVQCNVAGGVWGDESFAAACDQCVCESQRLWKTSETPPLPLSRYLEESDHASVEAEVEAIADEAWPDYSRDSMEFGVWARDILVNCYVVGDHRLIPEHEAMGRAHLKNLLLLERAYRRLIEEVRPDRVVSNDSYYGMWAILQRVCEERGIPFYSQWIGGRQGGWCYATGDAAMNLDFSRAWPKFSSLQLSRDDRLRVEEWMQGRTRGEEMIFDTASLSAHQTEVFDDTKLDPSKPTALLPANLIWDSAALGRQIIFEDMVDWIAETIEWFARHPEFQLIVKPHPAELSPRLPTTEERVETALANKGIRIPDNVLLLSPKSKVTVYELLPLARAALVHTTTVGIEMAARGAPVITTARSPYRGFGFTIDPSSKEEYFDAIHDVLIGRGSIDEEKTKGLAYKYILFYWFHYYMKIDIVDHVWGEGVRPMIKTVEELLPGVNPVLDYVCSSIIQGLPIVSEDRWPPES